MGSFYNELNDSHVEFIHNQKMFFVATAPQMDGKVNLSPKGYDTLTIVNSKLALYADYDGSGNETATHIKENQRITIMWNSFDDSPLILRIYGKGSVIEKDNALFEQLMSTHFKALEPRIIRQLFYIEIEEVQTSCGWGVPHMKFEKHREKLEVASRKQLKNDKSIS